MISKERQTHKNIDRQTQKYGQTDRHKSMDRQMEKINGKTDTQKIWTATGAEKTWTERQQDKGCGQQ